MIPFVMWFSWMNASFASVETMSVNGQVETDVLRTKILPNDIETFVLNAVVAKEYNDREMTGKQFIEVMDSDMP